MTIGDAINVYGVSREVLVRLAKSQRVAASRSGGDWVFSDEAALDQFMKTDPDMVQIIRRNKRRAAIENIAMRWELEARLRRDRIGSLP